MSDRTKLIKEIEKLIDSCPPDCSCSEVIAHFILEDRKRIVKPLIELPNDWKFVRDDVYFAIIKALKLAGVQPHE